MIRPSLQLRPATLADRPAVYEWLAHSELTAEMLGPPLFPDALPPSWEEFLEDYLPHYFDGSEPEKGRCFIIELEGTAIGQINYNAIDRNTHSTELDIWLAAKQYSGKGYGTQAIQLLCTLLHQSLQVSTFYIAPSRRNPAAIRAYQKVGFQETKDMLSGFEPDYEDAVGMVLNFIEPIK